MKVKFLKNHPAFGYFPGQTGEVTEEAAAKLLEGKFVEEVSDEDADSKAKAKAEADAKKKADAEAKKKADAEAKAKAEADAKAKAAEGITE